MSLNLGRKLSSKKKSETSLLMRSLGKNKSGLDDDFEIHDVEENFELLEEDYIDKVGHLGNCDRYNSFIKLSSDKTSKLSKPNVSKPDRLVMRNHNSSLMKFPSLNNFNQTK